MWHNIHLTELPEEGKFFEGEIRSDLFALAAADDPKFIPPLRFSLNVKLDGPDVIVEGSVEAQFELECVRCGGWFPYAPDLTQFYSQEPRDGAATLDLTALLREDILLALPGYPRCEDSNVETRSCPQAERFSSASDYVPLVGDPTPESAPRDVWGALDQIQVPPPKGNP
jgi:uncharacterized protein